MVRAQYLDQALFDYLLVRAQTQMREAPRGQCRAVAVGPDSLLRVRFPNLGRLCSARNDSNG